MFATTACAQPLLSHAYINAKPITLSLTEAIDLAVRTNPNVQIAKLAETEQKFNLYVQHWNFHPHYVFQGNAIAGQAMNTGLAMIGSDNVNIQPAITWLSPIGTQTSLTSSNPDSSHYNPGLSLQITQPLMRGFGKAVVEAALENAEDSEYIARLTIESTLRSTVSTIISAYLDVVSAERTIVIDQDAVQRAETSVTETKLFIKAGHKAGNELVTVEANVASAKSQLENDTNNLQQAKYALLTAIGLDPNTNVYFTNLDIHTLEKKYHLPDLEETKRLSLLNDIQYQTEQITLHGATSRALLIAEDNTRWQVNLTSSISTGNGSGGGPNAGINSLFNGANRAQSIGLSFQIPIDDQIAKQSVQNAKIGLQQAELGLMQDKWSKQTNAINGWNLVVSAQRALKFASAAARLQKQTYDLSYEKYAHGLIDSLELQTAQLQLIQAQQSLLNADILYIKSLVNLDYLIGNTLHTWNIQTRLT